MNAPIDQVLVEQSRVHAALQSAREAAASNVDAGLLAIAERRICQLLGAEPTSSVTLQQLVPDDVAHAIVTFVEQWIVDVANISDDMVATLRTQLDEDQLMDFLHALLVVEQRVRLDLAWHKLGLTE